MRANWDIMNLIDLHRTQKKRKIKRGKYRKALTYAIGFGVGNKRLYRHYGKIPARLIADIRKDMHHAYLILGVGLMPVLECIDSDTRCGRFKWKI